MYEKESLVKRSILAKITCEFVGRPEIIIVKRVFCIMIRKDGNLQKMKGLKQGINDVISSEVSELKTKIGLVRCEW